MAAKMNRRWRLKLLAGSIGATLLLNSATAGAVGLLQAYDAALKNDPTYRGAFFENEAGKENKILGRAGLLPNIFGNLNISRNVSDVTAPGFDGLDTTHPKYLSRVEDVELHQTVFNLDAYARYKQGAAQSKYAAAQFDSMRQDLILRVTGAYLDVLLNDEQLRLARTQRDMYTEQRKVNDHLFEKGEGTKTDMIETQSRLDVAEAQILEAQDALANARVTLAGIIGQDVDGVDGLAANFRIMVLPVDGFDGWKELALKNNPDLQAQTFAIEAARQELNKDRAGHAPRVDFVASYSKNTSQSIDTYNQDSTVRSIGFQVNIPLYAGGAVSAQARQAAANVGKARADLDAKTDKALVDLRKQYNLVVSSVAKIAALSKAVDSATLLITATEQSIKGGVRINLDLLNAQQQLITAKRDLAQARYNYLIGTMRLRADAGTLTIDDVREVGGYFR